MKKGSLLNLTKKQTIITMLITLVVSIILYVIVVISLGRYYYSDAKCSCGHNIFFKFVNNELYQMSLYHDEVEYIGYVYSENEDTICLYGRDKKVQHKIKKRGANLELYLDGSLIKLKRVYSPIVIYNLLYRNFKVRYPAEYT